MGSYSITHPVIFRVVQSIVIADGVLSHHLRRPSIIGRSRTTQQGKMSHAKPRRAVISVKKHHRGKKTVH